MPIFTGAGTRACAKPEIGTATAMAAVATCLKARIVCFSPFTFAAQNEPLLFIWGGDQYWIE